MGSYGKLDVTAYGHNKWTPERVTELENAVAGWLATAPGSFTSRDAVGCYAKALAKFTEWSGRSDNRDEFEIGLANGGCRAGCIVYDGESKWLLVLPSFVDTSFERIVAAESRLA